MNIVVDEIVENNFLNFRLNKKRYRILKGVNRKMIGLIIE